MHCVDLGESFQSHIYLQNLASIQPRTSPVKFAASRDDSCRSSERAGTAPRATALNTSPCGAPSSTSRDKLTGIKDPRLYLLRLLPRPIFSRIKHQRRFSQRWADTSYSDPSGAAASEIALQLTSSKLNVSGFRRGPAVLNLDKF